MNRTITKVATWSAVISAISSLFWFFTFQFKDLIAPVPSWTNLQAYADAYSPIRLLYIYPSLILPISFLVLSVCLHYRIQEEKRFLSLIALSLAIIYSVMASINYNIQAVAIRMSLAAGEFDGIQLFIPDNPHSIFNALANSYVYMAIAMFVMGFIFEKDGLQKWIRWILLAQIITAIGQVGWSMFGLNMNIFIATSMVWVLGSPTVFIMLAILFVRSRHQNFLP